MRGSKPPSRRRLVENSEENHGQTHAEAKHLFIESLRKIPIVSIAVKETKYSRRTIYTWRELDPEFEKAWYDAEQEGYDSIEYELWKRGVEGTVTPIVDRNGEVIGEEKVVSDRLLELALRAYRPERFNAKPELTVKGEVTHNFVVEVPRQFESNADWEQQYGGEPEQVPEKLS